MGGPAWTTVRCHGLTDASHTTAPNVRSAADVWKGEMVLMLRVEVVHGGDFGRANDWPVVLARGGGGLDTWMMDDRQLANRDATKTFHIQLSIFRFMER